MRFFRTLLALLFISLPLAAQAQVTGNAPWMATSLTSTVQTIKASRGVLQFLACYNPNAAVSYIQVFDASGSITVGTTVPKLSLGVPASSVTPFPLATQFLNSIKVAATATPLGPSAPVSALSCNAGFN